jgi:hypothetical protein
MNRNISFDRAKIKFDKLTKRFVSELLCSADVATPDMKNRDGSELLGSQADELSAWKVGEAVRAKKP